MGSRVIHIIHNFDLFIAFIALSSQHGVVYGINIPELFIASRALNSSPEFVMIIHNLETFMSSIVESCS